VLTTRSELLGRMRPHGALGEHLFDAIAREVQRLVGYGFRPGEGYVLGDSPLVLLTALTARMDPDPASSSWVTRPRRTLSDAGDYGPESDGPPLRVFTQLDTRVILEDFFWKLAAHAASRVQPTN
ncbi:MAG: hypothetical protein ABW001_16570, partial [Mycobacterium sp.]